MKPTRISIFLVVSAVAWLGCNQPAAADAPASSTSPNFADQAALAPFTAGLATPQNSGPVEPAGWRVDVTAWLWVLGVEGTVGAAGQTVDVSANFVDVLEASDSVFALSGRVEIASGRWGVFGDAMWASIGIDDVSGSLGFANVDVTFELTLVDFGVMYRIGEWEPTGDAAANARNTTLDLYGGARYTNLEIELDPALGATAVGDREWFDPIVGAKVTLPFGEHWHLMANGDVGGFGAASDFTWSATAVIGYDFTLFDHPSAVYFGYRAIGQDFSEGAGATAFVWDVIQHGLIFGFGMQF